MSANAVCIDKSAEQTHELHELFKAEKAKTSPRWRDAVKPGPKNMEGFSSRNFADAQTILLATAIHVGDLDSAPLTATATIPAS